MIIKNLDPENATQTNVARVLGLRSPGAVRNWDCPRNTDGKYNIPAVIKWRIEQEVIRMVPTDLDPDLIGAPSDKLEELRGVKVELAKLDLSQRHGELLVKDDALLIMRTLASLVRNATAQLQREYGNDAADIIREAIAELEPRVNAALAKEKEE